MTGGFKQGTEPNHATTDCMNSTVEGNIILKPESIEDNSFPKEGKEVENEELGTQAVHNQVEAIHSENFFFFFESGNFYGRLDGIADKDSFDAIPIDFGEKKIEDDEESLQVNNDGSIFLDSETKYISFSISEPNPDHTDQIKNCQSSSVESILKAEDFFDPYSSKYPYENLPVTAFNSSTFSNKIMGGDKANKIRLARLIKHHEEKAVVCLQCKSSECLTLRSLYRFVTGNLMLCDRFFIAKMMSNHRCTNDCEECGLPSLPTSMPPRCENLRKTLATAKRYEQLFHQVPSMPHTFPISPYVFFDILQYFIVKPVLANPRFIANPISCRTCQHPISSSEYFDDDSITSSCDALIMFLHQKAPLLCRVCWNTYKSYIINLQFFCNAPEENSKMGSVLCCSECQNAFKKTQTAATLESCDGIRLMRKFIEDQRSNEIQKMKLEDSQQKTETVNTLLKHEELDKSSQLKLPSLKLDMVEKVKTLREEELQKNITKLLANLEYYTQDVNLFSSQVKEIISNSAQLAQGKSNNNNNNVLTANPTSFTLSVLFSVFSLKEEFLSMCLGVCFDKMIQQAIKKPNQFTSNKDLLNEIWMFFSPSVMRLNEFELKEFAIKVLGSCRCIVCATAVGHSCVSIEPFVDNNSPLLCNDCFSLYKSVTMPQCKEFCLQCSFLSISFSEVNKKSRTPFVSIPNIPECPNFCSWVTFLRNERNVIPVSLDSHHVVDKNGDKIVDYPKVEPIILKNSSDLLQRSTSVKQSENDTLIDPNCLQLIISQFQVVAGFEKENLNREELKDQIEKSTNNNSNIPFESKDKISMQIKTTPFGQSVIYPSINDKSSESLISLLHCVVCDRCLPKHENATVSTRSSTVLCDACHFIQFECGLDKSLYCDGCEICNCSWGMMMNPFMKQRCALVTKLIEEVRIRHPAWFKKVKFPISDQNGDFSVDNVEEIWVSVVGSNKTTISSFVYSMVFSHMQLFNYMLDRTDIYDYIFFLPATRMDCCSPTTKEFEDNGFNSKPIPQLQNDIYQMLFCNFLVFMVGLLTHLSGRSTSELISERYNLFFSKYSSDILNIVGFIHSPIPCHIFLPVFRMLPSFSNFLFEFNSRTVSVYRSIIHPFALKFEIQNLYCFIIAQKIADFMKNHNTVSFESLTGSTLIKSQFNKLFDLNFVQKLPENIPEFSVYVAINLHVQNKAFDIQSVEQGWNIIKDLVYSLCKKTLKLNNADRETRLREYINLPPKSSLSPPPTTATATAPKIKVTTKITLETLSWVKSSSIPTERLQTPVLAANEQHTVTVSSIKPKPEFEAKTNKRKAFSLSPKPLCTRPKNSPDLLKLFGFKTWHDQPRMKALKQLDSRDLVPECVFCQNQMYNGEENIEALKLFGKGDRLCACNNCWDHVPTSVVSSLKKACYCVECCSTTTPAMPVKCPVLNKIIDAFLTDDQYEELQIEKLQSSTTGQVKKNLGVALQAKPFRVKTLGYPPPSARLIQLTSLETESGIPYCVICNCDMSTDVNGLKRFLKGKICACEKCFVYLPSDIKGDKACMCAGCSSFRGNMGHACDLLKKARQVVRSKRKI